MSSGLIINLSRKDLGILTLPKLSTLRLVFSLYNFILFTILYFFIKYMPNVTIIILHCTNICAEISVYIPSCAANIKTYTIFWQFFINNTPYNYFASLYLNIKNLEYYILLERYIYKSSFIKTTFLRLKNTITNDFLLLDLQYLIFF